MYVTMYSVLFKCILSCTGQGPFDGILGFSQGGSMLSTICARRAGAGLSSEDTRLQFKFAILVSVCMTFLTLTRYRSFGIFHSIQVVERG
jgi:hypothetical protein